MAKAIKVNEIYVSVDIEADGPIPGPNSMLSLGAAAFNADGELLGTFSDNLKVLIGAVEDPDTMEFWAKNKEAFESTRVGCSAPEKVMGDFVDWVEKLHGKPVFVGFPATYDFMFVYWYMISFVGRSPFSFSGIDLKTYAMAILKKDYRKCSKRNMPKKWFEGCQRHTHDALDDAIGQGQWFFNMMKDNRSQRT